MKNILSTLALISFISFTAIGQDDTSVKNFQFKAGINYTSALHYYGRTDSLKSSGFFPQGELWFTPDVYLSAAPVFVSNKLQTFRYEGTVLTLGMQKLTEKYFTHLYILAPLYKKEAVMVQSALRAQAGFTGTYLNPVINFSGGGDIKFSDRIDAGLSAGIDKILRFDMKKDYLLIINPSAMLNAGSQKFSTTYTKKTKRFLLPPAEQQETQSQDRFALLSYEFSAPVILMKDKWQLVFTPAYVQPLSLLQQEAVAGESESGKNMFYISAGLKYAF